jgi:flagellar assembly protein FliH
MTSSPDAPSRLLRGGAAEAAPAARLDIGLRPGVRHDARLVDPTLAVAFEEVAESVRTAARAEGYAVGWAEGRRAAAQHAAEEAAAAQARADAQAAADAARTERAVRALQAAVDALEARAITPATELADVITTAAFELATALLGRELALAENPGLDAIRRALHLAPAGRPVTARLHPDDAPAVRDAAAAVPSDEWGREITVVADPAVEPGGAIVDCDASRIDAQLGPALERVREALGL